MTPARDLYTANSLLELWQTEFPDLPFEAVVKQDLLRQGLAFTAAALEEADFKRKDYFIFTFDRAPLAEMPEHKRVPEEIRIYTDAEVGGVSALKPTVISVRLNPHSPYKVDRDAAGRLALVGGPPHRAVAGDPGQDAGPCRRAGAA